MAAGSPGTNTDGRILLTDRTTLVTHATGEELFKVWAAVEPALEGFPVNVVIPALLAICFTAQRPDIDDEQLRQGVKGASAWIAMHLSEEVGVKEVMH